MNGRRGRPPPPPPPPPAAGNEGFHRAAAPPDPWRWARPGRPPKKLRLREAPAPLARLPGPDGAGRLLLSLVWHPATAGGSDAQECESALELSDCVGGDARPGPGKQAAGAGGGANQQQTLDSQGVYPQPRRTLHMPQHSCTKRRQELSAQGQRWWCLRCSHHITALPWSGQEMVFLPPAGPFDHPAGRRGPLSPLEQARWSETPAQQRALLLPQGWIRREWKGRGSEKRRVKKSLSPACLAAPPSPPWWWQTARAKLGLAQSWTQFSQFPSTRAFCFVGPPPACSAGAMEGRCWQDPKALALAQQPLLCGGAHSHLQGLIPRTACLHYRYPWMAAWRRRRGPPPWELFHGSLLRRKSHCVNGPVGLE